MRRGVLSACVALLAVGCASQNPDPRELDWFHPTNSNQEFYSDRAECLSIARQARPETGEYHNPVNPDMDAFGQQLREQSADGEVRRVFKDCMRGRGYQLVGDN